MGSCKNDSELVDEVRPRVVGVSNPSDVADTGDVDDGAEGVTGGDYKSSCAL